jgi:hypothetical protein
VSKQTAAHRVPRPKLLVLTDGAPVETLHDLFGTRGFVVVELTSRVDLERQVVRADVAPAAAVLDFRHPEAMNACQALRTHHPGTVVVGIADEAQIAEVQESVDAMFCPPVDRALLFVRVVQLVSARRHGDDHVRKITGVVGVIRGNPLFHRAIRVLHTFVPPVNAGAILERALREIDARPDTVTEPDLAAIVASGRLADSLAPFGEGDLEGLRTTLATLAALLDSREGPEDPCIPVRSDVEITARTCG